ncbi:MAG: helix-turn-helix transcriptional regulator [Deltaproteobacteria bacterium]|nr:helix-turn-helix transcriptional regulator [Deltaproteobacteria bacterium]
MAFKDNLVRIRKAKGWTQQHLADQAGVTVGIIRRYEAGGATPNLPILRKLAEALEVSTDELVFDDGGLPTKQLDRRLAARFQAVARLPENEREAIELVLDAIIANHELRHLMQQQTERQARTGR